jgi:DNA-binding XRE family transcriptional regulator
MAQARQIIQRGGKRFVLVEESEYRRLSQATGARGPALPDSDGDGNRPAVPFARAVIARSLIEQRTKLGWTQAELARRSGVRVETLNRIERGRVTPDTATIAKLDSLLRREQRSSRPPASPTTDAAPSGARRKRGAGVRTPAAAAKRR